MAYYIDASGNIKQNESAESIQVRSADDLTALAANFGSGMYLPGLIAYTAGYEAIWQLNSAGEWVQIVGGDSDAEE